MFAVCNRIFQGVAFFLWICILVNLFWLSIFTWFLFLITLTIFLFWFFLTALGWLFTFVPILKFVFIPWHRRRCRQSLGDPRRFSVAFFHPYPSDGSENERILWTTIRSLLRKYSNRVEILVYTFEKDDVPYDELCQRIQQRCDVQLKIYRNSIRFVRLSNRFYPKFGAFGSIVVSLEALVRFLPDIYFDSIGDVFTTPCFSTLARVPVITSIDHLPIVQESNAAETSWISQFDWIYEKISSTFYAFSSQCSTLIICHSSWTKRQLDALSNTQRTCLIEPPCQIQISSKRDEQKLKTIVSFGPFQPEENQELQIRSFYQLLQLNPDYRQQWKLILIGTVRYERDRTYLDRLQTLVDDLDLQNAVELKCNISFHRMTEYFSQATIGLHTRRYDTLRISQSIDFVTIRRSSSLASGLVEMMAANVIVVAHQSGGPQADLIQIGQTGFLASDIDSYATVMNEILTMDPDEQNRIRQRARESVQRYKSSNFERIFLEQFDQLVPVK